MKNMIVWILLFTFAMPLAASQALAADETEQAGIPTIPARSRGLDGQSSQAGIPTIPARSRGLDGQSSQTGIVDVGNKLCPVMDGPVNGKDFVVYEGKRYGLCCPGCDKTFLSDPVKYIARVEAQEKAPASEPISVDPQSEEMERDMEQGDL